MTAGPALERKGDIAAFLTALEPRSVFFVDELHRLSRALEETFYPAMEDRKLPITVGQGAGARVVTLDLPPFTLVGATTRAGPAVDAAARPLRHPAPARALRRSASSPRSSAVGAGSSRSSSTRTAPARSPRAAAARRAWPTGCSSACATTPRSAWAASSPPRPPTARSTLLEVDERGLDRLDREILDAICVRFDGGPVGLSTLAVAVGEEQDTIEDVYEPYLLQQGLLKRTPRGRVATAAAYRHLGLEPTTLL